MITKKIYIKEYSYQDLSNYFVNIHAVIPITNYDLKINRNNRLITVCYTESLKLSEMDLETFIDLEQKKISM